MTYSERAQRNADAYREQMERAVAEGNEWAARQAGQWFAWWTQAAKVGGGLVAIDGGGPLLAVEVTAGIERERDLREFVNELRAAAGSEGA